MNCLRAPSSCSTSWNGWEKKDLQSTVLTHKWLTLGPLNKGHALLASTCLAGNLSADPCWAGRWLVHVHTDTVCSSLWAVGSKRTACLFSPDCHPIHQMDGKWIPIPMFLANRIRLDVSGCQRTSRSSIEEARGFDRVSLKNWKVDPISLPVCKGP